MSKPDTFQEGFEEGTPLNRGFSDSETANGHVLTDSDSAESDRPSTAPTSHPPAFWFIFWGEFAERCSYYGMRAILPLYMTTVLLYTDEQTSEYYSYFKSACYFLPLLGGFIADRFFGKYWTIVGFSVPYVLGHFVLGFQNQPMFVFALILLACGSGVTKPNISTLMGLTYDQKRPGQTALRTAAFQWFYFSINLGSTLSLFALPMIRDYVRDGKPENNASAYLVAFQFPAWLMLGALVAFAAGKRFYAKETLEHKEITPEERQQQFKALANLMGVFALMCFFWVAYEQNDNLWVFFARDHVHLLVDLPFREEPFAIAPDGFQFLNALFILILVPAFSVMWLSIDPTGKRFPAATKMLMGFLFTAGATGIMALAAVSASGGERVNAWWMFAAYLVLTVGEILVYGTGLELSYTAAPASMKGFITACFLCTNTVGNLINSQFSPRYNKAHPAGFFATTVVVVLIASVAFYFVGRRLTRESEKNSVAAV